MFLRRLTPMERVKHVNELKELQESDWVSLLEKIIHAEVSGLDRRTLHNRLQG